MKSNYEDGMREENEGYRKGGNERKGKIGRNKGREEKEIMENEGK